MLSIDWKLFLFSCMHFSVFFRVRLNIFSTDMTSSDMHTGTKHGAINNNCENSIIKNYGAVNFHRTNKTKRRNDVILRAIVVSVLKYNSEKKIFRRDCMKKSNAGVSQCKTSLLMACYFRLLLRLNEAKKGKKGE